MKIKQNLKKVPYSCTFSGIMNESQLDQVDRHAITPAKEIGCEVETLEHSTKVVISGTAEQMNKWQAAYNKSLRA